MRISALKKVVVGEWGRGNGRKINSMKTCGEKKREEIGRAGGGKGFGHGSDTKGKQSRRKFLMHTRANAPEVKGSWLHEKA